MNGLLEFNENFTRINLCAESPMIQANLKLENWVESSPEKVMERQKADEW